jgi:DNA-binding IclR family transcriptional regulator
MKEGDRYSIRAVERAVQVMSVVASSSEPLGLSEIAAKAGLSASTAFRLLRTLQEHELVSSGRDGDKYQLGFRVLEWSHALLRQVDVVAIARPFVVSVRDRLNETTGLAIPAGDAWIRVARAEVARPTRRSMDIGERAPLYWSSTGLVILAAMPAAELDDYLNRMPTLPHDGHPPPDPEELRRRVDSARARGYAEQVDRSADGSATIAAPIWNHEGRCAAVLAVTAPIARFSVELHHERTDVVLTTAAEIARTLGFRGERASTSSGRGPTRDAPGSAS